MEPNQILFLICPSRFFRMTFSFAVHMRQIVNGIISAMFSKHSVVKVTVPSAVFFQIHYPTMTFDNGFAHRFRFKSVWKRIMTVKNTRQNSLLKKEDCLKFKIQAIQTCFIPFPALSGLYAYR